MTLFRHKGRRMMPGLNTSSLPDLIFTVLFFFMIVTNMRKDVVKVEYRVPQGNELELLTNKSTTSYIYIGRQLDEGTGATDNDVRIQLNDKYVTVGEISGYIGEERARMSAEDASSMKVNIKADRDVPMGLINDIKQALRKAYVLNIVYSAEQKPNN